MKVQIVEHYQIHQRYKIQYERSAVKGVDGYKVEANGDDLKAVLWDAETLKGQAEIATAPKLTSSPALLPEKEK